MNRLWGDTTVNTTVTISAEERTRIVLEVLATVYQLNYKWEGEEIVEYTTHYHGSGEDRRVVGKLTPNHSAAMVVYLDLKNQMRKSK